MDLAAEKLLPFKELECSNINVISQKILQFLNANTSLNYKSYFSWNFINSRDLLKGVPELNDWFLTYKLKLRDVAVTVITTDFGVEPHKDQPPVITKINFPVLNTENTWNVWWDDNGNEIARVEMLNPLAFNAGITHSVQMGKDCKYPRIVLSCMFIKEPFHLLVP